MYSVVAFLLVIDTGDVVGGCMIALHVTSQCRVVSQSEVLGQFYNPNTTPKDKERVVVCLHATGQELH